MSFDLNNCDPACRECIKSYIKKHKLKHGDKFKIKCTGIPLEYVPESILATISEDPETAISALDPVTWAAKNLDWHCLDPDGSVWRRKDEEGTLGEVPPFYGPNQAENEERARNGKSPFHRPYQAILLRCKSQKRVLRIGRQAGKSESIAITILYHLFTRKNFSVKLIAPYQEQIDLVFSRIKQLIEPHEELANSIARNVKAPVYTIALHNGSTVKGFTAASRSGGDASSARGGHAGLLIFDEADMLNPEDIDATLYMIVNHPDAMVWMSSTPTGQRASFWKTCQSSLYKEFHYPSSVNPNWNEDLEEYFRTHTTQVGYVHEAEAEFGEQEEGVYQVKYVESAKSVVEYSTFSWDKDWVYAMGVDWNDTKIGSTFRVVGFCPGDRQFYTVDKRNVQREEWNQLAACQQVVELNRLWSPLWIYIDKGYGATQAEVLHKIGLDAIKDKTKGPQHPDAKLAKIVKTYDFGSSIEVKDPFSNQLVKKPAKPFMVENSVRLFETCTFKFPASDTELEEALLGYRIKRVSQSGTPVYEQGNAEAGDHDLDALNLALVAFAMEESVFSAHVKYNSGITHAPFSLGEVVSEMRETGRLEGNKGIIERTDIMTSNSRKRRALPAAHVNEQHQGPKIYSWEAFNNDDHPPVPQQSRAGNRYFLGGQRRSAPQRKKF